MKTADRITLVRVICAPLFFVLYFIPVWTGCLKIASACILVPLLIVAEITDYFDGFFSRMHKEVSDFGKLFDPFADVMLHLTTFSCFMLTGKYAGASFGYLHPLVFILILYREYSMNFLRMLAIKRGVAIAARKGGKLKTVLYVTFGFYCLFWEILHRLELFDLEVYWSSIRAGAIALSCILLVACYASFIDYLTHFKSVFVSEKK